MPFTHFLSKEEVGPLIYADSAGNRKLGFGMIFPEKGLWAAGSWSDQLFNARKPSIQLLELYTLVIAIDIWALSRDDNMHRVGLTRET